MKKYAWILLFIPLLGAILSCNTLMAQFQPSPTPERHTQTPRVTPTSFTTPIPAHSVTPTAIPTALTATPWAYAYTPAPVYRDAEWAVEMGWYTSQALAPRARPLDWKVDDIRTFVYYEDGQEKHLNAVLRYITPHFYLLFEKGSTVEAEAIAQAAERVENEIYPRTRNMFGEEWSPGIDGDPHIVILHLNKLKHDNYGEFYSSDECPVQLCDFSNGHEMFYITLDGLQFGSDAYLSVAAHELQHLIRYHVDGNESTWLDEGLAMLSETLNGHPDTASWFTPNFFQNTDVQLNAWPSPDVDNLPNYGAAYLFSLYLYERFGETFIRNLSRQPHADMAGVALALKDYTALPLNQVFGEWAVANLLDDSTLAQGQFGYRHTDLSQPDILISHSDYPTIETATVHQYAADYIAFESQAGLHLTFDGSEQTAFLPVTAHSGQRFWWSNRLDNSAASLETELDLTGLSQPKATFWVWYDLEPQWDVVMVQVSDDGGRSWRVVRSLHSESNSWWKFMFTGHSGENNPPEWSL